MAPESEWQLSDRDIQVFTTKDSGPGGQHRNKTESCVIMRHLATGIEAKASAKSQHANRRTAREMLEFRVREHYRQQKEAGEAGRRRQMVGTGMRGDKIRTYREQDDTVTDHRSGRKVRLSAVRRGELQGLLQA